MKNTISLRVAIATTIILFSCSKQEEFLSFKTNQSLAVPTTIMDYYALLKNEELFNKNESAMGTLTGDDDFYITTQTWLNAAIPTERNAYLWKEDIYENETFDFTSWTDGYERVYVANVVLEGVESLNVTDVNLFNTVKGTALFFRSLAFYNLIQIFCEPYDEQLGDNQMGIVLRLSSDIERKEGRASLSQSYAQVFKDLDEAIKLLPLVSEVPTQPSKLAVHALLARIYLSIHRFDEAYSHAVAAIEIGPEPTDFEPLSPTISVLSTTHLDECVFVTALKPLTFLSRRNQVVKDELYQLYEDGDLRKSKYFNLENNVLRFRGTYDIRGQKFSGLAMGEIYLIAAECAARNGDTGIACNYLNKLLQKRYAKESYVDFNNNDQIEVLEKVLLERRKELVLRGIRHSDLKRMNKYDGKRISVTREIDGVIYVLEPNSSRYVLPIPKIEVELNDIKQNIR